MIIYIIISVLCYVVLNMIITILIVSFISIWCFDVSYCDVNPVVQLQIKRCLYHMFEHQAEYNLGGSDKSWTSTWNQLLQNTP